MKWLLLLGAVALFTLPIASAKSYDIDLASPTMAGNTKLAAGDYTLKVNGSKALFINEESGKRTSEPVKIQTVAKKYSLTAVETTKKGDTQHLTAIELGGSKTKLDFD